MFLFIILVCYSDQGRAVAHFTIEISLIKIWICSSTCMDISRSCKFENLPPHLKNKTWTKEDLFKEGTGRIRFEFIVATVIHRPLPLLREHHESALSFRHAEPDYEQNDSVGPE
jgi:hypothetical protein